ncbi:hypothetical protein [Lentibacillus sp. Marseille-P4043]|uniref:hypothetical protein n=1 Tax=Lentibacillus sp. Marseille-P4043 TaxID=2040293 RepID=UPI000D0B9F1D|nr:hypothetical protein [Lentibacillus sp. Marseille-P4043]
MDDYNEKIEKLCDKMEKIETLLKKVIINNGASIVNIEQLDLKGPLMEYKVGDIDVDEVSGALNLGVNLGVPVDGTKATKSKQPVEAKMKSKTSSIEESKDSTSSHKDLEKEHRTKFPKIEKQIEEKLKELFPKDSNQHEQQSPPDKKSVDNRAPELTSPTRNKDDIESSDQMKKGETVYDVLAKEEQPNFQQSEITAENYQSKYPIPTYVSNQSNNNPSIPKRIPVFDNHKIKGKNDTKKRQLSRSSTGYWVLVSTF